MRKQPITIGGVTYPSRLAAIKALHIAIRRGATIRPKRCPVVIDGVYYQSQSEAARALGVSRQAINQRKSDDPRDGFDIDF